MEAPDAVEIVKLAAAFYRYEGMRLNEVRDRWDLGATAFYQLANAALDDPRVAVEIPQEVARLRRLRESRQRQRRAS